jgi:hypothetical protein
MATCDLSAASEALDVDALDLQDGSRGGEAFATLMMLMSSLGSRADTRSRGVTVVEGEQFKVFSKPEPVVPQENCNKLISLRK